MRTSTTKEVKIFCDKETQIASVRIFKYRKYLWEGGKTMDFKKNSPELERVFKTIINNSVEPLKEDLDLWDDNKDLAVTYVLEMKK
jgi:hypothetical protein